MSTPGVHYPHRIRLRGPWDCEPLGVAAPPPRRVTMPCLWQDVLPGFVGRARFTRRFGAPGRLDADERVWLTFAGATGPADVTVNGHPFGRYDGAEPFEVDLSGLLAARNELNVEVTSTDGSGGLWGEVALEIRRTAFLRLVRAFADGDGLRIAGQVVGAADRPLELYALVDGRNVAYATVAPTAEGRPFALRSDVGGAVVRVELIDISTVWYAVEVRPEA